MSISKALFLILAFSLVAITGIAQDAPFDKGVNLTNWFQAGSVQEVQFNRYSQQDFENIKSLGCDVIRLPINLHYMTDGAPDYTLDPLFLNLISQVIDWAEATEINLILDNHTFSVTDNTSPDVGLILKKVWSQMAETFEGRSDWIHYEILNEPHGIDADLWNGIQGEVIEAIREKDDKHSIVVGGTDWNSLWSLEGMPSYPDDNLIYTFHFYDPFLFSHQGATWTGPSMENLANVPFPYDASSMPAMPSEFAGTWIENSYNGYETDGTVASVQQLIDMVGDFQAERNVPVYCGEFGVYQPNSQEAERVNWYGIVREYLEEKGIAWTMWDYHGGFGIFNADGQGLFDHDFNVPLGEALGFNVPTQSPFSIEPDTVGFLIYDDFVGPQIVQDGYQSGELNMFSLDAPNYGNYCIRWTGPDIYQNIGFNFVPDRDLSQLKEDNYVMDFFVRSDAPWEQTQFDMRFVDTKTDEPEDHPWRMRLLVNAELGAGDAIWKRIRVPLKDFSEHGSWDNNQWYAPQGDFDWAAIDYLEIVTEQTALGDATLWFDHIAITNVDTVVVNDDTPFVTVVNPIVAQEDISIWPNPTTGLLSITSASKTNLLVELIDVHGKVYDSFSMKQQATKDFSQLPPGIYLLRFLAEGQHQGSIKFLKGL